MDHEDCVYQVGVTYLFYSIYSLLPLSITKTDKYTKRVIHEDYRLISTLPVVHIVHIVLVT